MGWFVKNAKIFFALLQNCLLFYSVLLYDNYLFIKILQLPYLAPLSLLRPLPSTMALALQHRYLHTMPVWVFFSFILNFKHFIIIQSFLFNTLSFNSFVFIIICFQNRTNSEHLDCGRSCYISQVSIKTTNH